MYSSRRSSFLWISLVASAWAQEVVPNRYIVEMEAPRKGAERQASIQKDAVRAAVAERSGTVRDSFEQVMNALVVEIDESRRGELAALPGVRRVYPDRIGHYDMDHAVELVKARDAWRLAGGDSQAGKGMKIAIVDSGIDIGHPAFQDDSLEPPAGYPKTSREMDVRGTNKKVIIARSYGLRGVADIRDLGGHGSAVASVAGAARHSSPVGEFSGIAPKAFLGSYRLDDNDGSFTSSGLMRALEDVAIDQVDVMNLSLGFFPQTRYEDDPIAQAVERLAERVIVSKSAGNMGPDPGIATAPASPSAITVGASWNDRTLAPSVEVEGIGGLLASRPDADLPVEPMLGKIADAALADPSGLLCTEPAAGLFTGRIVLIARGVCLFEIKLNNAQKGGAKAAIVYSDDRPVPTLWSIGTATLPAVMVGNVEGLRIKRSLAEAAELSAKISFDLGAVSQDSNQLAGFSSRGPSLTQSIHVDVVAPGADIYLATQRANPNGDLYSPNGYEMAGGTSFSAPMVAGAAAVVKAARPGLTVKQYKSLLVNAAAPFARTSGIAFAVQAVGAGRLDVERALRATLVADPVTVSFGAGRVSVETARDITVTNLSPVADTLAVTVTPIGNSAAAAVFPAMLVLGPGESKVVTVRLSASALTPGEHQGMLTIRGSRSEVELHVPYWYGASDRVAKTISLIQRTATPRPGERLTILMRIADAAGVAIMDRVPMVEAIEGDGTVEVVQSLDADYPGMWVVSLRMGLSGGVNVYRFKSGDALRTLTLQP